MKYSSETVEKAIHELSKLPGIGRKRAAQILAGWEDQKQIKEIMFFLQSQGVSARLAEASAHAPLTHEAQNAAQK